MLFDKYGEYHKEQKKEWQIDKGIKRGCSIIRIYCIVFSLAVAAFIIRVLMVAVLAILITAPAGAFLIDFTYKRFLSR